jgi:Fuc2NAc and GlcNAc transferase
MLAAGLFTSLVAGVAAFAVTLLVLRNATRLGVIADPNERSSHAVPTPSGGGIGIVAGGTLGGLFAAWFFPWPTLVVVVAGLAMAAIGFIDDRRHISAPLRLAAQIILAAAMVATLEFEPLAAAIGLSFPLVLAAILVLAAVYWINIFNFMDGIDGIAGAQAAFMLAAAIILMLVSGAGAGVVLVWWLAALAAAVLGFLLLNWPPARIFMGDAGSTYLGFMLAYAAYASIAAGWLSLWQWLILGALFVADATITLVRRLLRREALFKAHRLHAYQHLSRRWGNHRPVTLLFAAVNVVWLLPLAWAAGTLAGVAPLAVLIAYLPLVAGLIWAGAGAPERRSA